MNISFGRLVQYNLLISTLFNLWGQTLAFLHKYWAILSKFEHAQIGKVKMEGERLNLVLMGLAQR